MDARRTWKIGENVVIGAKTLRDVKVAPAKIGSNAVFLGNSTVYDGVDIGNNLVIGHNSVIREENVIGHNFKLWNNSNVDYGCRIGNDVKIHCNCYIAQGTVIEDNVFIAPGSSTTNDKYPGSSITEIKGPVIKKGAKIGARVVILPGVVIGENSLIGSGSVVTKDVPQNSIAYGNPAKVVGSVKDLKDARGRKVY